MLSQLYRQESETAYGWELWSQVSSMCKLALALPRCATGASSLTSLGLTFLSCKVGIIV